MSKANLFRKIGTCTLVGLLLLAFSPECKKKYDNYCLRGKRYNKAKLKVEQLADNNNVEIARLMRKHGAD